MAEMAQALGVPRSQLLRDLIDRAYEEAQQDEGMRPSLQPKTEALSQAQEGAPASHLSPRAISARKRSS